MSASVEREASFSSSNFLVIEADTPCTSGDTGTPNELAHAITSAVYVSGALHAISLLSQVTPAICFTALSTTLS